MLNHAKQVENALLGMLKIGIPHDKIFYAQYAGMDKIIVDSVAYTQETKCKMSTVGSNILHYYQEQIASGIDEYQIHRISILGLSHEDILKRNYTLIKDAFPTLVSDYLDSIENDTYNDVSMISKYKVVFIPKKLFNQESVKANYINLMNEAKYLQSFNNIKKHVCLGTTESMMYEHINHQQILVNMEISFKNFESSVSQEKTENYKAHMNSEDLINFKQNINFELDNNFLHDENFSPIHVSGAI